MPYYAARLHVVSIVDAPDQFREASYVCDYPFVVFQASDDEAAFLRALELGKDHETEYLNSDGQRVFWRLRAVEHIWKLGEIFDGIEIGSIMDVYRPEEPLNIDTPFSPEKDVPLVSDESCSSMDARKES